MIKNRRLSRSINDMGFFEFRRQLTYKTSMSNKNLIIADRFFASTRICSACDFKREKLALSEREWTCSQCNAKHDRDINAAINLAKWAVSFPVSANPTKQGIHAHACGASSNGTVAYATVSYGALKQEFNSKSA